MTQALVKINNQELANIPMPSLKHIKTLFKENKSVRQFKNNLEFNELKSIPKEELNGVISYYKLVSCRDKATFEQVSSVLNDFICCLAIEDKGDGKDNMFKVYLDMLVGYIEVSELIELRATVLMNNKFFPKISEISDICEEIYQNNQKRKAHIEYFLFKDHEIDYSENKLLTKQRENELNKKKREEEERQKRNKEYEESRAKNEAMEAQRKLEIAKQLTVIAFEKFKNLDNFDIHSKEIYSESFFLRKINEGYIFHDIIMVLSVAFGIPPKTEIKSWEFLEELINKRGKR